MFFRYSDICLAARGLSKPLPFKLRSQITKNHVPGHIAQSVTCPTADQGVASLILVRFRTFAKIDHEIISTAILLPCTESRRVVVSYKRKYVHDQRTGSPFSQACTGKKCG